MVLKKIPWSKKHRMALVSVVVSVLLSSFGYYFYQMFFVSNILVARNARPQPLAQGVIVRKGMTLFEVVALLDKARVIEDPLSFAFVARVLNYDRSIQAGYYELRPGMSNLEAVRLLRSGEQTPIRLRFHGLRLLEELPQRLAGQLSLSADSLLVRLRDDSVAAGYGFSTETFGLMFIPNSYEFYWTCDADCFLSRMKREYDRFWNTRRQKLADSLGLTPIEVGILASIVQAETQFMAERARIAGVYLNRLRRNIPLGADPTLIFAAKDFSIRRVLRKHQQIDSPYNTYRYKGLPPGAINLPEISSMEAVLAAEAHDYLYFCAKPDFSGQHVFSKTYGAHLQHARAYQRSLSKEQRLGRQRRKQQQKQTQSPKKPQAQASNHPLRINTRPRTHKLCMPQT